MDLILFVLVNGGRGVFVMQLNIISEEKLRREQQSKKGRTNPTDPAY